MLNLCLFISTSHRLAVAGKLYAWLRGLQLDLYSIDSTWDDLDSTSQP
ncbi:MAG TPA: hypothetical protein VEB40_14185 [Flavipsychrobacter sp.]|nr:hypothetical protein [Flavipsychrobacter sp.]